MLFVVTIVGISNRRRSINVDELRCAIDEQFAV
jgi:hypothetical protein